MRSVHAEEVVEFQWKKPRSYTKGSILVDRKIAYPKEGCAISGEQIFHCVGMSKRYEIIYSAVISRNTSYMIKKPVKITKVIIALLEQI